MKKCGILLASPTGQVSALSSLGQPSPYLPTASEPGRMLTLRAGDGGLLSPLSMIFSKKSFPEQIKHFTWRNIPTQRGKAFSLPHENMRGAQLETPIYRKNIQTFEGSLFQPRTPPFSYSRRKTKRKNKTRRKTLVSVSASQRSFVSFQLRLISFYIFKTSIPLSRPHTHTFYRNLPKTFALSELKQGFSPTWSTLYLFNKPRNAATMTRINLFQQLFFRKVSTRQNKFIRVFEL